MGRKENQRREGRLVLPDFDWENEDEDRFICYICRTNIHRQYEQRFEAQRSAET